MKTMVAQPLIAVRDVKSSRRWYERLLKCSTAFPGDEDHPDREIYERLQRNGQMLLQLHAWDEEDHPNLVNRSKAPVGHGVLLWFETDDFDNVVRRARRMAVDVIEEPHFNIDHREFWLRDPDGYVVVIAGESETDALLTQDGAEL